jgi:hypothetical protein
MCCIFNKNMIKLEELLSAITTVFPLPRRFRFGLSGDVAELSRLLTSARPERDAGYLGRPNLLSAYLRYFLPWNVFRLCRIFEIPGIGTDPLKLIDGDAVTDLGSGPLTLPIALWIARPELRRYKLEFRCVDHTGAALEAGKKLFTALVKDTPWTVRTIRGSIDTQVRGEKAKLVTAVGVFNEIYKTASPSAGADRAAALLTSLCAGNGSVLVVEPGNPRGGAFISAVRAAFLKRGRAPAAPCPHCGVCPLPGRGEGGGAHRHGKAKWCHFAFDTEDVPAALHKLSADAGIPKERAVLSYLLTGTAEAAGDVKHIQINAVPCGDLLRVRIISDAFALPPHNWGRYGCSERGLVLAAGNRENVERAISGTLLELPVPPKPGRDRKTGALIIHI